MSTVFLCRASGEGSHNFKVCASLEEVVTFYGSMFGEDTTGDLMGYLCDEDRWCMAVAYHEDLYCAKFDCWKVEPSELAFALPEVGALAGWISMKVRRPADFERVLCVNGAGYMTTANRFHMAGGSGEDWNGSDYTAEEAVECVIGGITHWMPLPSHPSPQKEIPRWRCGWVAESNRCLRGGCGKIGPCEGVPKASV